MEHDNMEAHWQVILKFILFYRLAIIQFIWPLICLSVFIIDTDIKIRCLYVSALMIGYWVTGCVPYFITGFLPVILMPLLAIQTASDVCKNYLHEVNMLFYASMFLSISLDQSGLHKRIALKAMLWSGCTLRKLNFSLTLTCALLSMWFINSLVTMMISPMVTQLLMELEENGIAVAFTKTEGEDGEEKEIPTNITKAFYLSTGYAAVIGGIGTSVGQVCNLTFKGLFPLTFPNGEKIDFMDWIVLNFGPMVLILMLMWFSFQIGLMGMGRHNKDSKAVEEASDKKDEIREIVEIKLKELGKISFHEIAVLSIILLCIFLWMTRSPKLFPGWISLYEDSTEEKGYFNVSQATVPIIAIVLLSAIPTSCVCQKSCSLKKAHRPNKNSPSLLPWVIFQREMPWGMILLLGGGFSLGQAIMETGLSAYLVKKVSFLMFEIPSYVTLALASFGVTCATEMVPHVVVCNISLIVLLQWSVAMHIHPLFLTYPITVCCSWSFCSIHGNRTNEMIVQNLKFHKSDLLKYGIFTKISAWLVTIIVFPLILPLQYGDLHIFPEWAKKNSTLDKFDLI